MQVLSALGRPWTALEAFEVLTTWEGGEAAALVVKACETLHPLIVMLEDPGSPYANFMYGTTVQTNAAQVGWTFSRASLLGPC